MDGTSHQLAAIMFTDIFGYTSLMGSDEQKALNALQKNREIHHACLKNNNGLLIKEMGDGNIVKFSSAHDAVTCALEIQASSATLEYKLRIGIHLAEVVIKDNDVFGDGVNIASRLEAIADPGGIYISESVQKAIRSHAEIKARFLAEIELKNIDYPVKIYSLVGKGLPVPSQGKILKLKYQKGLIQVVRESKPAQLVIGLLAILLVSGVLWFINKKPEELRLAILPIDTLTKIADAEYISAGMHSELIDILSNISALSVTSRTSSLKYNHYEKSIPEIATELGVDWIVESELLQLGDTVVLKVRLIDAFPQEKQVWRKEYTRLTKDILSIYNDIALEISMITEIDLSAKELSTFSRSTEIDPQGYQAYLTGMGQLYQFTKPSLEKAIHYFDLAITKDPEFAPAYIGIAFTWAVRRQFGYVSSKEALPEIKKASREAVRLDSTSTELYYNIATSETWLFWNWQEAEQGFKRTIELAPDHTMARAYYAHYLNILHRFDEATPQIEKALSLQPTNSTVRSLYGMHLNHQRKYDLALEVLKETLEDDPDYGMALSTLWTVYHNKKMYDQAIEAAKILYLEKGELAVVDILINEYIDKGYNQAMQEIAEAYILKRDTSYVTPWQIATLYVRAGNKNESLFWLREAYKEQDPNMPYINADPIFDVIRETKEFQALLEDMKL